MLLLAALRGLDLDIVFKYHAVLSIVLGGVAFGLPSGLASMLFSGEGYTHFTHELLRMYGALTLAQGWMVFQVRRFGDGRVRRCMAEAYCIAYGLQGIALAKAHIGDPQSHTIFNVVAILVLLSLSTFYGYCRWIKTIKVFELPNESAKSSA